MHLYECKRVVIGAGLTLEQNEKLEQLVFLVLALVTYCQMVDERSVINPILDKGRQQIGWTQSRFQPP